MPGLQETPELVSAGATAGLEFLDEGPRIAAESRRLERLGVKVQIVVIHEGTANGSNPTGNTPGVPWDGPILTIADDLQSTTVDSMIVGHTHRISNLQYGDILITEGINAGASYSVLQLMVKGGDVSWAGGATRVAKTIGMTARARRPGDHRRCQRGDGGTAQQGDRHAGVRHQARSDPAERVCDGQPGRGFDAGQVPGCRRCVHQLRWSAAGPRLQPAERGRGTRVRSRGARCSRCCRSATAA